MHLDASRIENVRSENKLRVPSPDTIGQRTPQSMPGAFRSRNVPFARIKPEHEASHIAATATVKILDRKRKFSSLLASALPLLFLLLTPPDFPTVSPRN